MGRPKGREIRFPGKQRVLRKNVSNEELHAAASKIKYAPSNYHCKINGKLARRVKPASPCPKEFSLPAAGAAIREAILSRRVSARWVNGFPKHVWHRDGDVWYEACTEAGTAGTYHAYPIEVANLPPGLL